jgi:ATP-dependent helicase/nuclease subunit B
MKVKLILGPYGSGKTRTMYDEIKKQYKDLNNNCLLIVPEQLTYQKEKDLIEHLGTKGLLNVQVMSFKRLSYMILEEIGGIKRERLDTYGKHMLVGKIIEELEEELVVYNRNKNRNGIVSEILSLVDELKESGVSSEFLKSASQVIQDDTLNNKIHDITKIYEVLTDNIQNLYLDEIDLIELASTQLKNSNYFKNTWVYIDEFLDFSQNEINFIKALSLQTLETHITLNMNSFEKDPYQLFEIVTQVVSKIRRMVEETGGILEEIEMASTEFNNNDRNYLAEHFFSIDRRPYQGYPENIFLNYSINPVEEVEAVAETIIQYVRDDKRRWKEFQVVVGHEMLENGIIERVFKEYNIPFFQDVKRPITAHSLVKMIEALIDIVQFHYKLKDVFKFLKCGFTDLSDEDIETFENYARKYGITGSKWFKPLRSTVDYEDRFERTRIYIVSILSGLERIRYKSSIINNIECLTKVLQKLNCFHKINQQTLIFKENQQFEKAYENSQIWNATMTVFDQASKISGDRPISLEGFRELLRTGFETYKLSIIPPVEDCVFASIPGRVSEKKAFIFVIGLNEGSVPRNYADKGIFLDEDRQTLRSLGANIHHYAYEIEKEKLEFCHMLHRCNEKIFMSFSMSDLEGKTLRPSIFVDQLKALFPNLRIIGGLVKEEEISESEKIALRQLGVAIREKKGFIDENGDRSQLYQWFALNRKEIHELIVQGITFKNEISIKDKALMQQLYNPPLLISPSGIESFNSCAFKYFIGNGIKPEQRKEYKVDFMDAGNIYHRTLERVTKKMIDDPNYKNQQENVLKTDIDKFAEDSIQELDDGRQVFGHSARNSYYKERIKKTACVAGYNMIRQAQRSEFKPVLTEVAFGLEDDLLKPIEIIEKDKLIGYVIGRIDRIDVCYDGERLLTNIIDYKSSKKNIDLSKAINGLEVQLMVYVDLTLNHSDKLFGQNTTFGGMFYFTVDEPVLNDESSNNDFEEEVLKFYALKGYVNNQLDVVKKNDQNIEKEKASTVLNGIKLKKDNSFTASSNVIDEETMRQLTDQIKTRIKESINRILDGDVQLNPFKYGETTPCTYCEFISVCQFDTTLAKNQYRRIKKEKDKDIIERISKDKRK